MAQFTVNPPRLDPYKNFKFRVRWDGRCVAGFSKVGALEYEGWERRPRRVGQAGRRTGWIRITKFHVCGDGFDDVVEESEQLQQGTHWQR